MIKIILSLLLFSYVSVADTPPIIYNFQAPLVKIGSNVSIPKADSTHNGYLSSADWNTFSAGGGGGGTWGSITGTLSNQTDLQSALNAKQDSLPSQAGNNGKFLTTNGSILSWGTVVTSVSWGSITGLLSNQTDLQTALNAKEPLDANEFHVGPGFQYSTLASALTAAQLVSSSTNLCWIILHTTVTENITVTKPGIWIRSSDSTNGQSQTGHGIIGSITISMTTSGGSVARTPFGLNNTLVVPVTGPAITVSGAIATSVTIQNSSINSNDTNAILFSPTGNSRLFIDKSSIAGAEAGGGEAGIKFTHGALAIISNTTIGNAVDPGFAINASAGSFILNNVNLDAGGLNLSGTSTLSAFYSYFNGSTGPAITLSGSSVELFRSVANSNAAAFVIDGSGSVQYDTLSLIGVTTINPAVSVSVLGAVVQDNILYSPATPGNWGTVPTKINQALDVLAATIAGGGSVAWGSITGTLSSQTDLQSALNAKEPTISSGTNLQYWRGDKTFQTLNTLAVPELTNLYFTNARAQAAVSATAPLVDTAGVFSIPVATTSVDGYLSSTDWNTFNNKQPAGSYVLSSRNINTTAPLTGGGNLSADRTISMPVASAIANGYLSSSDWSTFNNKLSKTSGNYITNPDAEVDTSGWNLYNDTGRTVPASVVNQDITYTSALSGNAGNGATVSYTFCGSSYVGPIVTCPSGTAVQVCWYNGPTLSQNPSATVLKAAYDAQSCATAIATSAITGTASKLQYQTGTSTLFGGGDTSPVDGTGGSVTGVTFTRNTSTPLAGIASFDLGKDANNREGMGVSTDFIINTIDENSILQISFAYEGSSGMVLGANSDAQVFVYDIGNAVLIPVVPKQTISGPVSTPKTFVGTFPSSTSSTYRLIIHIATASATAWDLLLDTVTVNNQITPSVATQVPSVVLLGQPISGAVTDHMVVMWKDGATQWIPATIAGAALPSFGDDKTQLGFATNIVGSSASIYIKGYMGGFSFGPFAGFQQYIDNTAGGISPLPSPFNDMYVMVGMAISSTELNVQFDTHVDAIANSSGLPLKGGLLSNSAINDGTGDQVLAVGGNGNVLVANSAASLGINWAPAVVAGTGLTYTTATRALALSNLAGDVTGAPQTNTIAAATVTGKALTGFVSGAGAITAADTILTGFNKINGNDLLKAPLASPTFTGTPTMPTGTIGVTQTAGNSTTALATTAFVTTANNLKANIAAPTLTGDVNLSTGNLLISTIGKGPQVKTGTNAKIGTAVLVAGAVTVANTSVTANSRIFVTSQVDGGTVGAIRVSAKVVGTSFTITSLSALDTSTVAWYIVESIP